MNLFGYGLVSFLHEHLLFLTNWKEGRRYIQLVDYDRVVNFGYVLMVSSEYVLVLP